MAAYIIRRVLMGIIILILVTIMVFLLMRLMPGDPLYVYLGTSEIGTFTEQQLDELRHEYGLDRPLYVQYYDWIKQILLHGDMGTSILYREKVAKLVGERMPITIHLGIVAFIFGTLVGITFGTISALRRGRWIDSVITVLANLGITTPGFWVGILMIYVFGLRLSWLPTYGYTSPFTDFWLSTRQAIMPVICLSLFSIASLTRQTRSSMLEVIRQDYIRTAWSKGLSERIIVIRHSLKNSLIPVVTILGMQIGIIFGGSVLIETVFNIPGIGRLMTSAVFQQDYQIVQAGVLIMATIVVLTNIVVDISYGWLDPRIRYE
jgi:peptide/nickel transport system permease protein